MSNIALIAGAGGASSKRLIETLLADPAWSVIGLARRARPDAARFTAVSADLLDAKACTAALAPHRGITHIFYTARAKHGETGVESVAENAAMLGNVLDAVEPVAPDLVHVHLVQGTKYYGMHLGPFPTPAREDDARHMPPNFYYDQQDLLAARQRGRRWTWSASRPNFIVDFAPERARNLIAVVGAYAAIARELSAPLDFPGSARSYGTLREMTDASLLARAMKFIATTPACANQAFNVTNGDLFRWQRLWPRVARLFGIDVGIVRPLKLADWMADKGPVWSAIAARHGLKATRMDEVADWPFADFCWAQDYDVISSTTKLRLAGFGETIDSEAMVLDYLARYRAAKLLP
jgi:nucleoside-diphosphate-sugar epimerase